MKRHFLVTGASSGLGKFIAQTLIERDHNVTILTTGNVDYVRGLHPNAVEVLPFIGDTNHLIGQLCERTRTFNAGPFTGMVHCGGAEHVAPLRTMSLAQYEKVMRAAEQAFTLLRAAGNTGVMELGSSIVLLSSVAASRGSPNMVAYSAAKAAIEAMARSAAVELAPRSIRVNCVAPGGFRTPMLGRLEGAIGPDARDAYAAKHPLGIGRVEDVAAAVLYLLSPESRWVTGTTLTVDGGFLA